MRSMLALSIAVILGCGAGTSHGGDGGPPGGDSGADEAVDGGGDDPDGAVAEDTPKPEFIPAVFGVCPDFVTGEITLDTSRGPRPEKLWIGDQAAAKDGPIVFYFHGWHGSPSFSGMTNAALTELLEMGGMFVAPYTDPEDTDEYWGVYDLVTVDQVVACAIEKVGIDRRRIHAIGYSAGGMQSLRFSLQRSGYVASAIMYSPGSDGIGPPAKQEAANLFASLITWGDAEDPIFGQLAESYFDLLTGYGQRVVMCHHAQGHVQPQAVRDIAFEFLMAHPFGTANDGYEGGLPGSFPSYCGLTK